MDTVEAELVTEGESYFIQINDNPSIRIPISEDNANVVKTAFSAILRRLRKGSVKIVLKETKEDLFFHVAREYLEQLNGEIVEAYAAMVEHGFIDQGDDES
jgi:hypothetical protein